MSLRTRTIAFLSLVAVAAVLMVLLASAPARAATFTVNSTADSGPGSLRQAIIDANASPGADTIEFGIPGMGVQVIAPLTPLPAVTGRVFIDGYSQPGSAPPTESAPAQILVGLDGGSSPGGSGIEFAGASGDSRVRGLAVHGWSESGIVVLSGGVQVDGNHVGLTAAGVADGNYAGVCVVNSDGDLIGGPLFENRNVISANATNGIELAESVDTLAAGNYVGTDTGGAADMGNGAAGIYAVATDDAILGGDAVSDRNVISGNDGGGVVFDAASGTQRVHGNYIGTNSEGDAALANGGSGVDIRGGSSGVAIGGGGVGEGNLISGNTGSGVLIQEASTGNFVHGNLIGTDAAGFGELANELGGVTIEGASGSNEVGGPLAGQGNVISGNGQSGVSVTDSSDNSVRSNLIGTAVNGADPIPNMYGGVLVTGGSDNTVGGDAPSGEGNVISCNLGFGVGLDGSASAAVRGNLIGTDASAISGLGNFGDGVVVGSSTDCSVGGTIGEGNVISANWASGVMVGDSENCRIEGNAIGVAADLSALPNNGTGVVITSGSDSATVGGSSETSNIISSNGECGVLIEESTDASVVLNMIHDNGLNGVAIVDNTAIRNLVSANSICGNGELGISLGGGAVPTPNDGDNNNPAKPNRGYNYPEFSSDTFPLNGGVATIDGTAPPNSFVEIFLVGEPGDPSGHGQGDLFCASVHADAAGMFTLDLGGLSPGELVSATAYSPAGDPSGAGNTSEFSANATVVSGAPRVDSVNPSEAKPGDPVKVAGRNFGAVQGNSTITVNGTRADVISWSDTEIEIIVPSGATSGPVVVTTAEGSSNDDKILTIEFPTWFLAEGTTGWGFTTVLSIANPNAAPVTARVVFMDPSAHNGGGIIKWQDVALAPRSQATVNAMDMLGFEIDFSTIVTCLEDKTIGVDRTMTWTGEGAECPEAHSSVGVTDPARSWLLPEGSSAWGFETWTLLLNPTPVDAHVTVTYMIEGGGPVALPKVVPGLTRATFSMSEDLGAALGSTPGAGYRADASIEVESDVPLVAERSMYRNGRREGSCSIGATAPATDFYLAEGTTAWGFTTYVLVQNPNDAEAEVTLTYLTGDGPVPQAPFVMPPGSRRTIRVNDALPPSDCSIQVHSPQEIVAERAMYWNGGPDSAEVCHDSIGMASPHRAFIMSDGQTSDGWETFTLVQNPGEAPVRVRVSYLPADGSQIAPVTDTIPAGTRRTYRMSDGVPSGRAAVEVEVLGDGAVMVERSMYRCDRGLGTDTIGSCVD